MSFSTFHRRRSHTRSQTGRVGFTLVELLVVIAIIGILVGLLIVAGRAAVIRANEFAVSTEITQMSQALEEFKTKYGFYPPSRVSRANGFAEIKRILSRVAPNHRHTDAQLEEWSDNTGDNLSERNSLVFWLGGGIRQSKQFPLGFGGTDEDLEVFFEFEGSRLLNSGTGLGSGGYEMEYGKSTGDRVFLYFPSTSYGLYATATEDDFKPYTVAGPGTEINSNTFQIYCAGIDADFGSSGNGSGGDINAQGVRSNDNLTNFGDGGRLEVFISNQ